MNLTNLEHVPGAKIVEHYGLVMGSTIRAKHVGRDIAAGFKNLFGGELSGYTELLQESRQQATDRMVEQAQHIDRSIFRRVDHGEAHVDLSRMVVHQIEAHFAKEIPDLVGRPDIHLDEMRRIWKVVPPAGGEVVHDPDLVARRQVCIRQVAADEPGPARHQHLPLRFGHRREGS